MQLALMPAGKTGFDFGLKANRSQVPRLRLFRLFCVYPTREARCHRAQRERLVSREVIE